MQNNIIVILILFLIYIPACKKNEIEKDKSLPFTVKVSALVLREKPDITSNKIYILFKGQLLTILEYNVKTETINGVNGTWVKIKSNQNKEGYVFGAYISPVEFYQNCKYQINPVTDQYCKGINNSQNCSIKIEKELIKIFPEVIRKDKVLLLKAENGKEIILQDNDINTDSCYYYNFRGYLKDINYYLIHIQLYEGSQYTLINKKNGEGVNIINFPRSLSSDKKYVLALSDDAYSTLGFQIINISGDKPLIEINHKSNWIPYDVTWIDNNSFELSVNTEIIEKHTFYSHKVRVTKKDDKWIVED